MLPAGHVRGAGLRHRSGRVAGGPVASRAAGRGGSRHRRSVHPLLWRKPTVAKVTRPTSTGEITGSSTPASIRRRGRGDASLPCRTRTTPAQLALDGHIYAVGGQHARRETTGNQSDVHRYDAGADAWSAETPLPQGRGAHRELDVRLRWPHRRRGRAVNFDRDSLDVLAYVPSERQWTALPSLPGRSQLAGGRGGRRPARRDHGAADPRPVAQDLERVFENRWETGPPLLAALGDTAGGVIGRDLYVVGRGSGPRTRSTSPPSCGRHARLGRSAARTTLPRSSGASSTCSAVSGRATARCRSTTRSLELGLAAPTCLSPPAPSHPR